MGESSKALKHFPGGALISLRKELCTQSAAVMNLQRSLHLNYATLSHSLKRQFK